MDMPIAKKSEDWWGQYSDTPKVSALYKTVKEGTKEKRGILARPVTDTMAAPNVNRQAAMAPIMGMATKDSVLTRPLLNDPSPKGYKPLSQKNRSDWNAFARFLNKDKKIGGSPELDDRTNAKGLALLDEFKKLHPDFTITPDMVKHIQYEFQQLKNTNSLPDTKPEGRVKTLVQDYFKDRDISAVDGWIGSKTSRQGYPEVTEFSDDPQKRYWGLDYSGASKYEKEVWDKKKIIKK